MAVLGAIKLPRHFDSEESKKALCCHHCGKFEPEWLADFQTLLDRVSLVREAMNVPITVTSGYRCLEHPIEKAKRTTAVHAHTKCASGPARVRPYQAAGACRSRSSVGARLGHKGCRSYVRPVRAC